MNRPSFQRSVPVRPRRVHRLKAGLAASGLVALAVTAGSMASAAGPALDLQTAEDFSVLAGSGISNTGVTSLSGSIGSYETPTVTTDTPFVFTGAGATNHAGNGVTQQAKSDLLETYGDAAAALPPTAVPEELSRLDPYLAGIYRASSSMVLSGPMTLDGGGRNDGVWVFQASTSTLTTASNATVLFVNGAQPCNVYWQVGSSATFGTGTTFGGNVLADTSITANTGARFAGRLLANNGAVTLDSNTFTAPGCEAQSVDGADDADSDGTDTDGADGADSDGTDTDGPDGDADGAAADSDGAGSDGSDAAADADDGAATVDADSDAGSADADGISTALPDAGGPPWSSLLLGAGLLGAGAVLVHGRRARGTHRA